MNFGPFISQKNNRGDRESILFQSIFWHFKKEVSDQRSF